jgi:hypothetical protein
MQFPALLYKCPGDHFGPEGTTYSSARVKNDSECAQLLKDGWHETMPDAVKAFKLSTEKRPKLGLTKG